MNLTPTLILLEHDMANYKTMTGNYKPDTSAATTVMGSRDDSTTSTAARFGAFFSQYGSTEADKDITIYKPLTVIRLTINLTANSKGTNSLMSFRDDGADAGTVTITASTTGEFDSGVLSVAVATDSVCCLSVIGTAAGTLTWQVNIALVTI